MTRNWFLGVGCLSVFLLNSVCFANLLFKLTASSTVLSVDEEATIGIWAKIDEPQRQPGEGLNVWQLDMVTDTDGVVAVKTDGGVAISLLEPWPQYASGTGWQSVNSGSSGNVLGLGVTSATTPQNSDTAIGDWSLLAEVTVVGIGAGQVGYALADTGGTGFYGILRDAVINYPSNYYDIDLGNLEFLEGQSDNILTVVPEPASVVIMAIAAGIVLRRRGP